RLTSFVGRNTPAFIISISAVPPAMGRTVSSSGSSSWTAAASEVGSASSKGVIGGPVQAHHPSSDQAEKETPTKSKPARIKPWGVTDKDSVRGPQDPARNRPGAV